MPAYTEDMTAHSHGQPHPPTHHHNASSLGIASLILGILSVTMFNILTGIPAIITGVLGLKHPESKGMSIAGIIMGAFSVLIALLVVLFFVLLLIFAAAQDPSQGNPGDMDPGYHYDDPYSGSYQQRT